MATLIACANGNLTAAATWQTCDATSLLNSENSNQVLSMAYQESQTFTPGAITIDGIAVKIARRMTTPSGTVSVRLAQAGATVAGTEVTINISDVAYYDTTNGRQGWYFFKFAAPVTLIAATLYTVSAKTSVATGIWLWKNATNANWTRLLRTTTTAAPVAGDSMIVTGEWTAAGTVTARTVTMDSTAATDYGDNTPANPPGFCVGNNGTVSYGVTAATNYILRLSTSAIVYQGGVFNIGSTGNEMPRDSTAVLEFDCAAADGDYGLIVHGTFSAQGLSRTSGKDVVQALMSADAAAAATTINVNTDTGWLNTDEVAIASTTRTSSEAENRILNGNAGASSFNITVGLTNAHGGVSPVQAEVILLTRNIRIRAVTSTLMTYVDFEACAVATCKWVDFRYLGVNGVSPKYGLVIQTVTGGGSVTLRYCTVRDCEAFGILVIGRTNDNFTIQDTVLYNVCTGAALWGLGLDTSASSTWGTNWSIVDVTVIRASNASSTGAYFQCTTGTIQRLRVSSCGGTGIQFNVIDYNGVAQADNINVHSNTQTNINIATNPIACFLSNVTSWRSNGTGLTIPVTTCPGYFELETGTFFGNTTYNIRHDDGFDQVVFRSVTCAGDSTFSTANGIILAVSANCPGALLENCSFGVVSGIFRAHTTADINISAEVALVTRDTVLASATQITGNDVASGPGFTAFRHQKFNATANTHRSDYPCLGTVEYESAVYRTASPSEKMTPNGVTQTNAVTNYFRLRSTPKYVPVGSGQTVTIQVYVRKNSAYNGPAPRLIQMSNAAIGLDTMVVLDTFSVAADTWELLTGTTAAATADGVVCFFVDCNGSAGVVYVDDWTASVA